MTLSRFPFVRQRAVLHDYVPPLGPLLVAKGAEPQEVRFDRPLLLTEIEVPDKKGAIEIWNAEMSGPEERTLRLALGWRMGGRLPAVGPET